MDSLEVPVKRGIFARTVNKILHLPSAIGVAAGNVARKTKLRKGKSKWRSQKFDDVGEISADEAVAMIALLSRLFASISSITASYAQLQLAESPYDRKGIQSADKLIISELTSLSELKQCYIKKQFHFSPDKGMVLTEIQEQNSVLKSYEITLKRLETESQVQYIEIEQFKALLEECGKQNKLMQRKLNESGYLYVLDNVHPSGLNPSHFISFLHHTVRSIQSFVKMLVTEMDSAGWDLDSAANAISPGTIYWKDIHYCFGFESFLSLEMFNGFQNSCYYLQHQSFKDTKARTRYFYQKFSQLESTNVMEYLSPHPNSTFGKFCMAKYLTLIHPDMELSLCHNLSHRKLIKLGELPETAFFTSFAEMAKRVWMLHCLAFSFDPQVSVFQIRSGSRYSEVYMESVTPEVFLESIMEPRVAFTVVPGFQFEVLDLNPLFRALPIQ